ncbi:MAG: M23 family peptidase, partial [Prevotella sp.]|nr:M23 family peptidase [Prevotella sp.]
MKALRYILVGCGMMVLTTSFRPVKQQFSAMEQQSICVETPGLFEKSNEFRVDFGAIGANEYSFPLPVGKA